MSTKESKFEIDPLEERIAPVAVGIGGIDVGVSSSTSVGLTLPLLGNVGASVATSDSVSVAPISLGLSGLSL